MYNYMNKIICIYQKIKVNEFETNFSLSNEQTTLFNKFKNVSIVPIHNNTDLEDLINNFDIGGIVISGGNDLYHESKSKFFSNKNFGPKLRDDFELKLINSFIKSMQRLSVDFPFFKKL